MAEPKNYLELIMAGSQQGQTGFTDFAGGVKIPVAIPINLADTRLLQGIEHLMLAETLREQEKQAKATAQRQAQDAALVAAGKKEWEELQALSADDRAAKFAALFAKANVANAAQQ